MKPWKPDASRQQARRIGKTLEELGELTAVLSRISIQGLNSIDPGTGKTNRHRMIDEMADVLAQFDCNIEFFNIEKETLADRIHQKTAQMKCWEAHFQSK